MNADLEIPGKLVFRAIVFTSKILSMPERKHSNLKEEALSNLHELKKIHHYCFSREVRVITHYKSLIALFQKDVSLCHQDSNACYFT